jgi:hypothetical protein
MGHKVRVITPLTALLRGPLLFLMQSTRLASFALEAVSAAVCAPAHIGGKRCAGRAAVRDTSAPTPAPSAPDGDHLRPLGEVPKPRARG